MNNLELKPLTFVPYLKSVIWGGNKICVYKGIEQPEPNIGESWEISAVPGHESVIAEGKYKGLKITELIDRFPKEILGTKVIEKYGRTFPLLIKIIDAADNLSVQVHPDDELARLRHNSLGKTEMWYIIDSDKGAKIFSGLNTGMTPDDYIRRVADGTFAETLAIHDSEAGDVFFLPAGRVHAIGAGNLLAEIQESSDITYRIYDYDRRDANGNTRELHTELAKDAIDFSVYPDYKSPRPDENDPDTIVASCRHFTTRRIIINGSCSFNTSPDCFSVLICVKGDIEINGLTIPRGHSVLIPAALNKINLDGNGVALLTSSCK